MQRATVQQVHDARQALYNACCRRRLTIAGSPIICLHERYTRHMHPMAEKALYRCSRHAPCWLCVSGPGLRGKDKRLSRLLAQGAAASAAAFRTGRKVTVRGVMLHATMPL